MARQHGTDPRIPVIDLFAGPGGLGEGFSAPVEVGGTGRFRIALSIEKDPVAHQTLQLRALFRQFRHREVPEEYYRYVRGEISREQAFGSKSMRNAAVAARQEAWNCELGVEPERRIHTRIRKALGASTTSVLIGGPPCQAYSLVGRSRNRGNPLYKASEDGRHTLYREYLKVLAHQWPAVFVMENVKGLLSARLEGERIFDRIVEDLKDPASAVRAGRRALPSSHRYQLFALAPSGDYGLFPADEIPDPRAFIVRCEDFGIPQARHRVILLGVREDALRPSLERLVSAGAAVPARDVICGLPRVRSGLSKQPDSVVAWREVLGGVKREQWLRNLKRRQDQFSRSVAERILAAIESAGNDEISRGGEFVRGEFRTAAHPIWYHDERLQGVPNHSTRSHIVADIRRYLFASAFADVSGTSPTLAAFPDELLPAHENVVGNSKNAIFADRFRVQVSKRPSTTVTSHIAKDGHYYIHFDPSQARSLTAREAARLQTFPDNYFFCGGRTAQYHQIGNAVPPLLAKQIAEVVAAILS